MKISDIMANSEPHHLPKAMNIDCLWWHAGYLVVRFKGRRTLYVYANVPKAAHDKLLSVPYPDKLLTQLRKKHGWPHFKVEA